MRLEQERLGGGGPGWRISLMGGLALAFHMELSPDPACAEADDAVMYIPKAATFWLAGTTAPRAPGGGLNN